MLSHLLRSFFMASCFLSLWTLLFLLGHNSLGHVALGSMFFVGMLLFATSPFTFKLLDERKKFGLMLVSWLTAASIGTAWLVQYEIVTLSSPSIEYQKSHDILYGNGYWWFFSPSDPDSDVISRGGFVFLLITALALLTTADRLVEKWKQLKERDKKTIGQV